MTAFQCFSCSLRLFRTGYFHNFKIFGDRYLVHIRSKPPILDVLRNYPIYMVSGRQIFRKFSKFLLMPQSMCNRQSDSLRVVWWHSCQPDRLMCDVRRLKSFKMSRFWTFFVLKAFLVIFLFDGLTSQLHQNRSLKPSHATQQRVLNTLEKLVALDMLILKFRETPKICKNLLLQVVWRNDRGFDIKTIKILKQNQYFK